MSGPASERVQKSALEEIVFTDSIPYTKRCEKLSSLQSQICLQKLSAV